MNVANANSHKVDQDMQTFPNRYMQGSSSCKVTTNGFTATTNCCNKTLQRLLTDYHYH